MQTIQEGTCKEEKCSSSRAVDIRSTFDERVMTVETTNVTYEK